MNPKFFNLVKPLLVIFFLLGYLNFANAQCPTGGAVITKVHTDITCFGADDGTITVELGDGATPLNFELFDNALGSFVTLAVTEDEDPDENGNFRKVTYTNVYPSSFQVVVFKAGCPPLQITETPFGFLVQEPADLVANIVSVDPDCDPLVGTGDGNIDINTTGGVGGNTFLWNDGATTEDRINIDAGLYTLTVTDANGCTDVVNVPVPVATQANAGADQTVCADNTNLAGNSPGGGEIGTWTVISGSGTFTNANSPTTSVGNLAFGANVFRWTITDSGGLCTGTNDDVTITRDTPASVDAGPPQTICSGTTVTLAGVIGGTATSATWTTSGDGTFNNAALLNAIYTPGATDITNGTVTLTLTTNDPAGPCPSVSDNVTITINPAATVDAGPVQTICSSATATMAGVVGGGATSGTWSTSGDGSFNNANLLNAIYTPGPTDKTNGTVTLTLTTNDPAGPCPAVNDNVVITINPEATVDAGPPQTICSSSTVALAGVMGGSAISTTWTTSGDGTFNNATLLNAIYTPGTTDITNGTVTLTLTTNDPAGPCPAVNDNVIITINPAATVDAGPAQTICSGTTASLAGVIGGGATSATWTTSGDGTFNNASLLNAIYTPGATDITNGTVTLTLTTNDPAGPCPAVNDNVIITINKAATADAGLPQTICSGSTVSLAGVIGGSAVSSTWTTSGDGTFNNASLLNAVYTPGATDITNGTVTLTITTNDPAGPCPAVSDNVIITINQAATADAGAPQTICSGSTVSLAGVIGGVATSSTWTTSGDGTFDNAALLNAVYTPGVADRAAGTVTLTITTNDPAGPCTAASDNVAITINPQATADAGPAQTICSGSTVSLAGVIGGSATSLTWTTSGDGTFDNANLANAVYTPGAGDRTAGTVTLTITTNDPAGPCTSANDNVVITINQAATADAGVPQTICAGSTVNLAGVIGGSAASSTWTTSGDGTFDNAALLNAVYTPGAGDRAAGTVTLTLTTNDPVGPCPAATDNVVITINPTATVDAGPAQTICSGSTVSLAGVIGGGATSSTWTTSGDGTFDNASLVNAVYTPGATDITNGTVTLTLTTNDPAGPCPAATDNVVITINPGATADAGTAQTICAGGTVSLAGVIGGSAASLTWTTSGDGTFDNATLANAVYTPGAGDRAAGTVTLTLTTNDPAGPCPAATDNVVITINPAATADAGLPQTICAGSTVGLTGVIGGGATTLTWTTSGDGTFDNATLANAVYTPGATDITNGTVTLTITTNDPAGPCPSVNDNVVITINQAATADAGPVQTICTGSTVSLTGVIGGSAVTLTWTTSGDGTFDNATLANAVYTPGAGDRAAGTVTLTLTTNDPAGPCPAATDNVVITINPAATADAGLPQTICAGSAVNLTGVIGGGATTLTWTTSGDGTFDNATLANAVYTPGATDITNGTVTLTLTTNDPAGPCPAVNDNVLITINQAATSDAGPTQTICAGGTITLAGVIGGVAASSTWTTSGDGTFDNASLLNAVYTPGNADRTAGTVTLTLTTNDPAGPCPAASDNVVMTINPAATVDAGPSQAICSGSTATLAGVIGGGATSATWSTSGDGTFNNTSLLNAVYTPGATDRTNGTVTLTLTTNDPAGPCTSANDNVVITINPAATTDAGPAQTICSGNTVSLAGVIGGSATSSTWTTAGDGTFDNASLLTAIYTPGTADRAAGSVTLTLTTNDPAGPCPAVSDNVIITINPAAIVDAGPPQSVCAGSSATLAGTRGGSATTSIWTTAGDGTFNNVLLLNAQYTPGLNDIAAGTVTLTLTTNDPAGPCPAVSDQVIITVGQPPTLASPQTKTICSGANVSYEILMSPLNQPVGTVFNWPDPDGAGPATAGSNVAMGPAGTIHINDVLTNTSGSPITVTYVVTPSLGTCTGSSQNVVITVDPSSGPVLVTPQTKTICSGANTDYEILLSPLNQPPGTRFNWPDPDGAGPATAGVNVAMGPAGTKHITDVLTNTSGAPITVTYVITPVSASGCAGTIRNVVFTVNPFPVLAGSQAKTICNGANVSYEILLSPVNQPTGTVFNWPDPDGAGPATAGVNVAMGTPGTIHINDVLTNSTGLPITITYVVTASVGSCSSAPQNVVITVSPSAGPVLASPQTKTICSGANTDYEILLNPVNQPPGTVFNWPDPDGAGPASAGVNVAMGPAGTKHISDVLTNTTSLPITVTYAVTPVSSTGCSGTTRNIVFTVNPTPVVAGSQSKTVCSGANVNYEILLNPANQPAGTVFNWPDPDGAGPATAGVNVAMGMPGTTHINDVLTNSTGLPIVINYNVTASVGSCSSAPQNVAITVDPSAGPVLVTPQSRTICSGATVGHEILLNPANLPVGTVFNWPDPDGTGPATAGVNVPMGAAGTTHINDILTNTTGLPIVVNYVVTPVSGSGCSGTTRNVEVTVNPVPVLVASQAKTICSGTNVNYEILLTPANQPAGTVFNWPDPDGVGPATAGVNVAMGPAGTVHINDVLTNTTGSSIIVTYAVTASSGTCGGAPQNVAITVRSSSDPLCVGTGTCANVVIDPQPSPASCALSTGSIFFDVDPQVPAVNNTGVRIDITGPVSDTKYNSFNFTGLPAGLYTFRIEYGDPSCIKTGSVTIDKSGTVGTPEASNILPPTCYGDSTGSATIKVLQPVDITGQALQWSLTPGVPSSWKNFTAGGTIVGIPAGLAPSFAQTISIRKNSSDPCYAGVTITMPNGTTPIQVNYKINSATCSGNDGGIRNIVATGGHGGYKFSLDGGAFKTDTTFRNLSGGIYDFTILDQSGCQLDTTANVTFPNFVNFTDSIAPATCDGDGRDGKIFIKFSNVGTYLVALSKDPVNEPTNYVSFQTGAGNSKLPIDTLTQGTYYFYAKPSSGSCPTRSSAITINGAYAIDFDIVPVCNGTQLSISLENVTGDPSISAGPLEIQVSKKFSNDPPETFQVLLDDEIYLDYNDYQFLKTPGEYIIKILQFQSVICIMESDPVNFIVPFSLFAKLGAVSESYPDIATGMLTVNGFVGGTAPYEVRLELDSASSVSLPPYDTDFEEVLLNNNQQFEKIYKNIPPGRYIVQVADSFGCNIELTARVPLDEDVFIPNVFTPNEDGKNDIFFIRNLPAFTSAKLIVTNRWGKEVYASDNYQNNWNGTGAADGIYFYRLQVKDAEPITGWVEIMRGQKP